MCAPQTGGAISLIDQVGIKTFVAECDDFAKKYGAQFEVPKLLRDMAAKGQPPAGTEYYVERGGRPLLVKKQVVLTGDRRRAVEVPRAPSFLPLVCYEAVFPGEAVPQLAGVRVSNIEPGMPDYGTLEGAIITRDGIDACPVCARLAEAAWREAKASGEGGQARDAETRRAAA